MMMMGYAYQKGLLPLSAEAIEQAIEVNGVAVKMNTQAFQLGRLAAADPARLAEMMKGRTRRSRRKTLDEMSLDEIIAHRAAHADGLPERGLAERYRKLVTQVRDAAIDRGFGEELPRAVAINYAKLLAYKDEYEVARLYTDGTFRKAAPRPVRRRFQDQLQSGAADARRGQGRAGAAEKARVRRLDDAGVPRAGGPARPARHRVRYLRPQRRPQARARADRGLRETTSQPCSARCRRSTLETAVELLSLPDRIRGYGPVKEKAAADAKARHAQLVADLVNPPPAPRQIAAE